MAKTRLDSVVDVRERDEDKAMRELGRAQTALKAAQQRSEEARRRAMSDHRARHDVAHWEMMEVAHHRALSDARRAEREVEVLNQSTTKVREQYVVAYQRAEVVRRVADARRTEAQRESDRAETKELDEVGGILFVRRAG
jgi:flagellar export protein FliJ